MITAIHEHYNRGVSFPDGFKVGSVRCGLKSSGSDIAVIIADAPCPSAGAFTTNRVKASCVKWSRKVVENGRARVIVVNAGNANACNGSRGDLDTARMASIAGNLLQFPVDQALIASTGVIGHLLPMEKLEDGIPKAVQYADISSEADTAAAMAIMTTDTHPKMMAVESRSDAWNGSIHIGAMCKGSGMIAPNMATMLCFLTTDAQIEAHLLQDALTRVVKRTFNRVTVDTDTSTNDMCLILASGKSNCKITNENASFDDFCESLELVCRFLAKEIARDGEGATKLIEVTVSNALTEEDAVKTAKTVAESPLVKTAIFGSDPNWGRILAAAGRSGVDFDVDSTDILIEDVLVCYQGTSIPFDEQRTHELLKKKEVKIAINLNSGNQHAVVYTCDYSYDYIKINAEYHT